MALLIKLFVISNRQIASRRIVMLCRTFYRGKVNLPASNFVIPLCIKTNYFPEISTIIRSCTEQLLNNKVLCHSISKKGSDRELIQTTKRNEICKIWRFFINLLLSICNKIASIFRIFELGCIFVPLICTYPVASLNHNSREIWFKMFVCGIQISGPIFIKLGQWASTRLDLFSEEFCYHLSKLQRKTFPHSWYYTEKVFEEIYGPNWKSIFIKLDNNNYPIGSGCCAQVYKAWVNMDMLKLNSAKTITSKDTFPSLFVETMEFLGISFWLGSKNAVGCETDDCSYGNLTPVAVKVRHPRMEVLLRRDLSILHFLASSLTWLLPSLKWLSLTECVNDFSNLMRSQIDMEVEAHNLERFANNFKSVKNVQFPSPVWSLTTPTVLVETYEEGELLLNYVTDKSKDPVVKKKLANVGINAILKMVFDDNFAHGDLHPGNMLVRCNNDTSNSKHSSKPSKDHCSFSLVILDCGIVASLNEKEKQCLKKVFASVAEGNGVRVAELFLENSNHQCSNPESFKKSMDAIVKSALDKTVTLAEVDVSTLMGSLFSTMINHQVKLDANFSSIILAIMVLEGLGRSLDPSIDIVEKAQPFLVGVF